VSALTPVTENQNVAAMRALVHKCLPNLSWRHHGIGVLQAYVVEDDEPEVRVHIWSPDLVKPGMDASGDIHDHRFDMVSHVLVGDVVHEEWHTHADVLTPYESIYTTTRLTHARAASDTKFAGPTEAVGDRLRVTVNRMVIPEGHTYRFPAQRFHRTPVHGLVVTLVEKHRQQDIPARLLHPVDVPPVMAFGHDIDPGLLARTILAASDALGSGRARR
jgi:hypothetical protein